MSNTCRNLIVFENKDSFNAFQAFMPDGNIDFSLIVPEPENKKDLLKEIIDGSDEIDDDFLSRYSVVDTWKYIYWGNPSKPFNTKCESTIEPYLLTFETRWNPPFGIVKALWDKGIKFKIFYNDESDNNIYFLKMSSPTQMEEYVCTDINVITIMSKLFDCPNWIPNWLKPALG